MQFKIRIIIKEPYTREGSKFLFNFALYFIYSAYTYITEKKRESSCVGLLVSCDLEPAQILVNLLTNKM